jgi:LPS export ABC transporter permease LptF/LPS export ABC transporter permease LptG
MRLWTRLDRYVTRELGPPLLLGFAGFTLVLLLQALFLIARQTIEKRVPLTLLLGFVVAEIPRLFAFTIPMSILLAVLVGIGRMGSQGEVTALRAAGVGPARLFRPVLAVAALLTLVSLGIAHYLMPMGQVKRRALVQEIVRARDLSRETEPGVFYRGLPGAVLYVRSVSHSAEGPVFEGVLLQRQTAESSDLIVARRGRPIFDRESGRISFLLDDGEWHMSRPDRPTTYSRVRFERHTLTFPPDPALRAFTKSRFEDPTTLSGLRLYDQIREHQERARAIPDPAAREGPERRARLARIEWQRRWAIPFACIALAFAAFPLAMRHRRGGMFAGLSQSLVVIFLYYLILSTGQGLAEQGAWPPWLAAWLPDAATVAFGLAAWRVTGRPERTRGRAGLLQALLARLRPAPAVPAREPLAAADPPLPAPADPPPRSPRRLRLGLQTLDLYLAGGFLRMTAAVLFVLLVLALAIEFKGAVDNVPNEAGDFPWQPVLSYVLLSIPGQLRLMVPIAALVGVSIALSALARANELIALKASGIGPVRIAVPVVVAAAGIALLLAAVQERIIPVAERESRIELDRISGKSSAREAEGGRRWIVGEKDRLWAYLDVPAGSETIVEPGVVAVDWENARVLERVEAHEAVFAEGAWDFLKGWRRTFDAEGVERFEAFPRWRSGDSESPELFGAVRSGVVFGRRIADQMTFGELRTHVRRMADAGYDAAPLVVGLNEKLVMPLLPVVLVLVAVPLTVSGWSRRGSLAGFGYALVIVFGFWVLWAVSTSLGSESILDPVLAVWSPPILVAILGIWLLGRAR